VSRTDERSRPMRRVAPSVVAGEQLQELLAGGVDRESNVISVLVELVTRLVVQELFGQADHDLWVEDVDDRAAVGGAYDDVARQQQTDLTVGVERLRRRVADCRHRE
jgi:hypothetical protein